MATVRPPCPRTQLPAGPKRLAVRLGAVLAVGILALVVHSTSLWAQNPNVHYQHEASMSPGAIGSWRLRQGGPLPGYVQPVEIRTPEKSRVALAVEGRFGPLLGDSVHAGMLVGAVYRLRVTNIDQHPEEEVYPTVEIIDRTYPPLGHEIQFPIVIEIPQDDIELALRGRMVTRVVYLENPLEALPRYIPPREQQWHQVAPGRDPLLAADELGRPMAIVRLGGRIPDDTASPPPEFMYGSPPVWVFPPRDPGVNLESGVKVLPRQAPVTAARSRDDLPRERRPATTRYQDPDEKSPPPSPAPSTTTSKPARGQPRFGIRTQAGGKLK